MDGVLFSLDFALKLMVHGKQCIPIRRFLKNAAASAHPVQLRLLLALPVAIMHNADPRNIRMSMGGEITRGNTSAENILLMKIRFGGERVINDQVKSVPRQRNIIL
jgi:hypothetical protein